jgi:hypothetical protein
MRKRLITLSLTAAFAACGSAAAQPDPFQSIDARLPAHPALYSFVDVYRLTVSGPIAGLPGGDAAPQAPLRVAVTQTQPSEPRFSIGAVPRPDKWLLIFAGVALAGWVAHRRLVRSL